MGTIETEKDADLFITTGDPLDAKSDVKHLFINGRHTDMVNWWDSLYKKRTSRPIK